ncbi:MAG: hypothetical protein H6735_12890 [Alphaproteobacteria bacterium]|nr:hypothetical protein [Alphaproteobacteria bacterium]
MFSSLLAVEAANASSVTAWSGVAGIVRHGGAVRVRLASGVLLLPDAQLDDPDALVRELAALRSAKALPPR